MIGHMRVRGNAQLHAAKPVGSPQIPSPASSSPAGPPTHCARPVLQRRHSQLLEVWQDVAAAHPELDVAHRNSSSSSSGSGGGVQQLPATTRCSPAGLTGAALHAEAQLLARQNQLQRARGGMGGIGGLG